jgi:hypothetical protein
MTTPTSTWRRSWTTWIWTAWIWTAWIWTDVDLDGVVPDRPCDLLLAVLRRRASAPVWVRVVAATPWVRVADFTALLR